MKKLYIDYSSFFKRQPPRCKDDFSVNLITGYQGSGKTYFGVLLLLKYLPQNYTIYTNIKSLKIKNRKIIMFETLEEIEQNNEEYCIFLIDEISKKYTKECRCDHKFYSWLQQSRKNKRIVLLITQEYLQCPLWLRGIALNVYTTTKLPLLPIFRTYKGYAYLNDDKEWCIEPLTTFIYKRNKCVSDCYDTFEPINIL